MNVSGTIGTKHTIATYDEAFKLTQKNKVLLSELDFICFQRTGASLKTADVVWAFGNDIYEHTIDKNDVSVIVEHLQDKIDIFDIGVDPGNWPKWKKKAIKENWQKNDWINFVSSKSVEEIDSEEEEDDANDSEWNPGSESEEEEDEEEDSEEEEEEEEEESSEDSASEDEIELADDSDSEELADDELEAEEVSESESSEDNRSNKRRKLNI